MLQDKILIIKFLPVDGLATSAVVACEVTTLAHKSRNNSVKAGAFIAKSFLPSAQSTKVFCCFWNFVCKQLEGDATQRLTVGSDVEKHGGVDHGWTLKGPRPEQCLQGGPNSLFSCDLLPLSAFAVFLILIFIEILVVFFFYKI